MKYIFKKNKARHFKKAGVEMWVYMGKKDCEKNANRNGAKDKWEFYTDKRGEHRWRSFATNGRQVGRSSEGFSSKKSCQNNAKLNGWSS